MSVHAFELDDDFGDDEPVIRKSSELVSLATIKPVATDWLWLHRIPRGAQTISTGWPGVGKSQQQCDIVAHTSTGTPWPDGSPCPCGDTIMLTCEDSYAKTVVPRLIAAGANLERVHALPIIRIDAQTKRAFLLTEDLDELERHLSALPNAILVTIDPITGFLGTGKINSNSVTDIRGALAPLGDLAERRNVAIHTVTHPPKTTTSAMNAFIGSQAFIAASRMAHLTTEEVDEEGKPTGRFLMAMVRTSLGPKMPTLAYRLAQVTVGEDHRDGRPIIGSYVVWEDGVVDISANAALSAASGAAKGNSDDHTAKDDCTKFLKTVLADGWIDVANITAEAISAGLLGQGKQLKDSKPMRDAKVVLKVETHRDGFGKGARYFWALPGTPWAPSNPMGALYKDRAPMENKGAHGDREALHAHPPEECQATPVGTLRGDGGTADDPTLGNGKPAASPPATSSEQAPAHGGNGHDSLADDGTIPEFLDRRHEVCAQCLAGRPDDPPTVAVTARNGETVYVHERGCLRFWEKDHGNGACS
jgi:putative DNA primase/helicase